MGQNKEELKRLLAFIDTLVKQPGNDDFVAGLRALLMVGSDPIEKERLEQIYEYCIERNLRQQAEGYYASFPIKELVPELVDTYVLMESFKRKNDFLNFGAQLFKQIEGIANHICKIKEYKEIFTEMYNSPSLVEYQKGTLPKISSPRNKGSDHIGKLIFGDFEKTPDGKDKSKIEPKNQYIQDRIKIALYFAGYASCMYYPTEFNKIAFEVSKLYLVRCEADHSGNGRTAAQEKIFQEVVNNVGKYYVDFICLLNQFVEKITYGFQQKDALYEFVQSCGIEDVDGIVSSALPSALYVKIGNGIAQLVPSTAYDHKTKFENGMKVYLTMKHGTILKVERQN